MIGLAIVLGLCVTGTSAKPATQEGPKIVGYDCTQPTGSRVYQAGGSCAVNDIGAGRTRGAQIYQHVPETRPRGWSCQLIATSHVRYCGISSYTQTIPVGVTEESRRVSLADCISMVEKKVVTLEDGKTHRIEVPGETRLVVQVAGSEVISNGVMTCQGENRHVNGFWLKDVIIEEQVRIVTTQEEYVELNGLVQSETDRIKMECDAAQGGCVGVRKTFIWNPVTGNCPYQMVTAVTGTLDDDNHLYTSNTILGAFNISKGLISLPTECSPEQTNLLRTQYTSLFIYLGERPPTLQTLQRDVDLEIQAELIEDSVARLQQVVSGVLQRSSEVSACQARAAAQWN